MGRPILLPAAVLMQTAIALGAEPQAGEPVAYVQATISEPDPAGGSLGFVSASGRARVARVGGAARSSLSKLRVGDEVILTLEGSVITAVKVSRLVEKKHFNPGLNGANWPELVESRRAQILAADTIGPLLVGCDQQDIRSRARHSSPLHCGVPCAESRPLSAGRSTSA